ncbi:MFS general substrate transporter [Punctularia strigosozonata HHB-11173 SS5]|uniref:MFS general substrate transporter n=1 Tax=Punctularia strigosozonata (strain HHB-11173) TaxID=741275 RepID=UPI0004418235|nr:MFS general substrate transporter [Punctularia strigosozonata HHB-11173 SS5]EIN06579.1 MFS general substrate transporter [Punctularia strigosozonata HHB-11173 SS5]
MSSQPTNASGAEEHVLNRLDSSTHASTSAIPAQVVTTVSITRPLSVSASGEQVIAASASPETKPKHMREVVICISAFTVIFMCCGINFAFGVYQSLYEKMSAEPGNPFTGTSTATIGLIGTLSVAFMQIAAPLASAWVKRFSPKVVLALGGALFFLACLLASFSQTVWQFLLTQGFLLGMGTCIAYITAVTVTPTWFAKRRGLAMGIILSGTGVGGLVWAPAIQAMNERYGFRTGLRITGSVGAATIIAATFVLDWDEASKSRLRQQENAVGKSLLSRLFVVPLVNWRVAKSKAFTAQALGTTFHGAAYYIPLFYFSTYAATLDYSATAGANFIAINNACNAIGKIVIGFIADRWLGRINTLVLTTLVSTMGTAAFWIPSTLLNGHEGSRGLFIAFSLAYGTFASAYVSLFPASLVEIFGPAQYASVNGLLYMLRGFGGLVGAPIAGVLIRGSGGAAIPKAYWPSAVLVSALLASATLSVAWVWHEAYRKTAETRRTAKHSWRM